MSLPVYTVPPDDQTSYVIDQLEGERITIPGSKGVFRILASSKQTNGAMAVFQSGAVLSDAPGFHWHEHAHDIFLVTKGFLKLWNGTRCRVMGPGDFAYVPPKVIHNPEQLGPHTETFGLVAPGDWVDFFRHVGEPYDGLLAPESDERDLRTLLMPKVMAARDRFDVHFVPDFDAPALGDWVPAENVLPGRPHEPYFLRANTGPRWMLGGVMSRPFITTTETEGKFAVSSIESSSRYPEQAPAGCWLAFPGVCHCFCVMEGILKIRVRATKEGAEKGDDGAWSCVREGQTALVAAGQTFSLGFASRYVRVISFSNGKGLEEVIHRAGSKCESLLLPDAVEAVALPKLKEICDQLCVSIERP